MVVMVRNIVGSAALNMMKANRVLTDLLQIHVKT